MILSVRSEEPQGFCSDLFAAVFSQLPHIQTPSKESFWITIPSPAASTLNTPAPIPAFQPPIPSFLSTSSSKVTCPYSPSFWAVHEGCSRFSSSRVMPGTGTERILSSLLLSCVLSIPGKAAATRRKSCKEPQREEMKTTAETVQTMIQHIPSAIYTAQPQNPDTKYNLYYQKRAKHSSCQWRSANLLHLLCK